jgi:hypothetical protein
LVEAFLRHADARGSDVRLDIGIPYRAVPWPRMSICPDRWVWRKVKSIRWKKSLHINVLELRMYLFTLQWRARSVQRHSTRSLHFLDSQVSLAVSLKGRSSSKQLNRVLRKISSVVLASDQYALMGYVGTKVNPADEASREFEPRHGEARP